VLTFPRFARLEGSRSFRLVVFALSACVFAFALHLAWLAFSAPLEIEIREGSGWLYVLAKRAGVDIYDTTQVAFVNMNHGPLDPILKTWISRGAPVLPGHMVTRVFVLLTPVFLLGAAYLITRGHLAAAMLAAGTLFLVLAQMSVMVYVGRSDATAVCLVALCGALAQRLLVSRHRNWSNRRYIVTQLGLGAASAAVFLTSWRFAPVIAALQVAVLSTQLFDSNLDAPPTRLLRKLLRLLARVGTAVQHLVISSALFVAGFAALWVPVFLIELHGDARSYYRHFFGFFLGASGWGTFGGAAFRLLPDELLKGRLASLLFVAALTLWGLYRLRKEPGELISWLVMLSANWLAVAYGYFKNQGGGGLHYFFEFFALAWIFIVHAFSRRRRWGALPQLLLVCAVGLLLPYRELLGQRALLAEARTQGRVFRKYVAEMTGGQPVFGEETHLFKSKYRGELVDAGDVVAAVARSGYFGDAFTRTYGRYTARLASNPPRFVMGGLLSEATPTRIMSGELQHLLGTHYKLRVMAKRTAFATAGSQALFERAD
jgi:hypothetical protein